MAKDLAGAGGNAGELFAVMTFDGLKILLPQREIRSLEPVFDIDSQAGTGSAIGELSFGGRTWPVYCLGADLALARSIPPDRRVCVLLDDDHDHLAVLCNHIDTLGPEPVRSHLLPVCMAKQGALVEALVVHGDMLNCVTTTHRLAAFFESGGRAEQADG